MRIRISAATITAIALAAAGAKVLAQDSSPWKSFAGEWKLNAALSDASPADDTRATGRPSTRGDGPPGGGGMMVGGPGDGSSHHGPGGPGGPGDGKRPEGRPPAPGGATSLLIGLEDGGLRVSADGGDVRILTVGGPPVERARGPVTVTETVTWESGVLTVRSSAPERPATTEAYSVGEDGRLSCTVTIPPRGDREERTMHRVYDRVAPAKGSAAKAPVATGGSTKVE